MSTVDLTGARWFKSSYSTDGQGSDCVEVAFVSPVVAARDSKNPGDGALTVTTASWRALLAACR